MSPKVAPRIARAENDLIFDEAGRRYIDLFSAHGTAWLGHANPRVAAPIVEQLGKAWITGGLGSSIHDEARSLLQEWFPASHRVASLYSTGMEAAEFALRVARVSTGRSGVVGFENGMHGKSLATAALGWDNGDGVAVPDCQRLPFLQRRSEAQVLSALREALADNTVSAVFVEPIQGCGGGRSASDAFYREVRELCRSAGTLLVFDELLTGFHRTGPRFYFEELGFVPDIVLIGKALGNGFPVSGVVVGEHLPIRPAMMSGSTFSGNPLASAAVVGTLQLARTLELRTKVSSIERVILGCLAVVCEGEVALRGRGALWVLELPEQLDADRLVGRIYESGVAIGHTRRFLRILPAATIDLGRLAEACDLVRQRIEEACNE